MSQTTFATADSGLEPQRFETSGALTIAGIGEHYGEWGPAHIPAQWQKFAPFIGRVPGQKSAAAYGVVSSIDDSGFEYLAGVEVDAAARIGNDFVALTLAPRRYAVFFHDGNVSGLHDFCERIWSTWAPHADIAKAPFFERYDSRFDPRTGNGGVEVWIPLVK
jgi:AraC family transcriptional regulator